jgi:hypothetical protein
MEHRPTIVTFERFLMTDALVTRNDGRPGTCAGCDLLDAAVAELATAIVANSAGTNRIAKKLIADYGESTRPEALLAERTLPHRRPDDMAERMRSGGR